jgi:radical SAM-linked protein
MVRQRARIRFAKQGDLRLIGHRDLVRTIERTFRRAGLRLGMSQGFHPKPRMSFPSALAVGIAGLDEVMEVEWAETYAAQELVERLAPHWVPGLTLRSVEVLPPGAPKARVRSTSWEILVPPERLAQTASCVSRLCAGPVAPASEPPQVIVGADSPDPRPRLDELTLRDGVLHVRLRAGPQGAGGPRDVLAALGLGDLEQAGIHLTRTRVELEP